jgi:hypothetical protein
MTIDDLSVEDLHAIAAKNWDAVSVPGLQTWQQHLQQKQQAIQQSQNPQNQTTPDPADKASRPKQPYLSPGESATNNVFTNIKDRIVDPNRWKAIATGDGPAAPETTGSSLGAAGLAIPMEAAPSALQSLAGYLGKSGVGPTMARIGANTAIGGAQGAATGDAKNAAIGAGMGAVGGTLGEAVGGLASLGKYVSRGFSRMTGPQSEAYLNNPGTSVLGDISSDMQGQEPKFGVSDMVSSLKDPSKMPALQDRAVEAINTSRKALKAQGLGAARTLSEDLSNKYVPVNPQEIEAAVQNLHGIDPRADEILDHYRADVQGNPGEKALGDDNVMRTEGATPDTKVASNAVSMPANEVNQLKRYLQEGARYAQGSITQPVQPAKIAQAAQMASSLRAGIEQVSPEAAELNKQMQDGMMLQEALRRGAKTNPLAFVSSEAPDRVATLARAENSNAGGLLDFGNQLGAAKSIVGKDVGSGIPTFLGKAAGRAGLRASDAVQSSTDAVPVPLQALLKGLFAKPGDQSQQ